MEVTWRYITTSTIQILATLSSVIFVMPGSLAVPWVTGRASHWTITSLCKVT